MKIHYSDNVDKSGNGFENVFYASWAWRKCARGYRQSVGDLCERCREKGLIVPAEEVHHKIHLTSENINRPEIALNWQNLIALCKNCHINEHRKEKRWTVDDDGNVIPQDPP